ncbi:ASKHA domain-containing protein [bacterium]|nr:ASKHA domain-containing protein [bacterium]
MKNAKAKVTIFGVPVAGCKPGKTWKDAANLAKNWLTLRFGKQVEVEYIEFLLPKWKEFPRIIDLINKGGAKIPIITVSEIDGRIQLVNLEKGNTEARSYALACDIGTTTLVVNLVDLNSGKVIDSKTSYNPQRAHGEDVTSRMVHCDQEGGLSQLHQLVVDKLNSMVDYLDTSQGTKQDEINGMVCAGNTIMIHILLGFDPRTIRKEPYVPLTTFYPVILASETGIKINPYGITKCLPGVSGYIGGDITAGVLSTGLNESNEIILFIDIGTNGETVLGSKDWIVACSGSAGSAFEGCGLEFGMNATSGAIEKITLRENGELNYETIGNESPKGICGSALIDLLAQLLEVGIINRQGKINPEFKSSRIRRTVLGYEFVIAWGGETQINKDIVLTQGDIDNLIRDKAALYAGSTILLKSMQMEFSNVEKLLIAGNFGRHLDVEKAISIGLLPDIERSKIEFIGNSSIDGATKALLSIEDLEKAQQIATSITTFELTREPSYYDIYTSALFLPHTDMSLFPSVKI